MLIPRAAPRRTERSTALTSTLRSSHPPGRLAPPGPRAHAAAASLAFACAAHAQSAPVPVPPALAPTVAAAGPTQLEPVIVEGNYDNSVGTSDAASQGTVTARLIASRPTLRPAEVLEFVPGVIVSQHSGDGKANQYYLRGFNLDHGTDFATFVDGMPVNMPTHAHGQGYSDLNWLIPELVRRMDYRKGPYYADEGDFSSAGAAHIALQDQLPRGIASLTIGAHAYGRALLSKSLALGEGESLLVAVEAAHNDGPWVYPEKFHRLNGVLRYAFGNADARSSITAMAYSAGWNSTDQIPQRAVDQGLVGRFGAIDPTDGGQTSRYSLSYQTERRDDRGAWKVDAYAIRSALDLYSDFTFNLEKLDPRNADQFEQAEHRQVVGAGISRSLKGHVGDAESVTTLGLQVRHDRLDPVGLYATVARQRVSTTQEARVRETSVGAYGENSTQWTPWLRTLVGVRWDNFHVDVTSSVAQNSGEKTAALASPKLGLIFGPWAKTEFFVDDGAGFHSNDARGVTETVTPKERLPAAASPALVRSKGAEVGMRTEIVPGLQSSLALWQLRLGSELVFSGDAGDTQPSGASKRFGIELNNHYLVNSWLLLDLDVAASHARFDEVQGSVPNLGRHIPGSVDKVVSLGATVNAYGPWFGHFQLRYFGPRPLIEDNSERSKATTLAYLRVGVKINADWRLALDIFNLFDRQASDIDYYYASRLPGESVGGVNDIHFHPVEPRSLRLTLTANF
ncbi:MAG: TonB-dependent receptor [Pseudomonadota bacterium]|nr:TonB-dependent receptor [Pseudomonadota bacterium]